MLYSRIAGVHADPRFAFTIIQCHISPISKSNPTMSQHHVSVFMDILDNLVIKKAYIKCHSDLDTSFSRIVMICPARNLRFPEPMMTSRAGNVVFRSSEVVFISRHRLGVVSCWKYRFRKPRWRVVYNSDFINSWEIDVWHN